MPPLTNTQQALGIGGAKPTTAQQFSQALGGGGPGNPWQTPRAPRGTGLTPPAYSSQIQKAGLDNSGPSLAAMYQGLNPSGPPGSIPANTRNPAGGAMLGVGGPPPAKPSAPPAQASMLNSVAPGFFNGQANTGAPAMFQPQGSPRAPQPPQNPAAAPPMPAPDPNAAQATMQAEALAQPVAGAEGVAGDSREAAGPMQPRAAESGAAAENGPTGPVASWTGANGQVFQLKSPLPQGFNGWDWGKKKAWLDANQYVAPLPSGGGPTTPGIPTTPTTTVPQAPPAPVIDSGVAADALSTTAGGGDSANQNFKAAESSGYWGNNTGSSNWDVQKADHPNWFKNFGIQGLGLTDDMATKLGLKSIPNPETRGPDYIGGPMYGIELPQDLFNPGSVRFVREPEIRALLTFVRNKAAEINQLSTDPGDSTSQRTGKIQELYQQMGVGILALGDYGLDYRPFEAGQDAPGTRPMPGDPGYDPYGVQIEVPSLGSSNLLPKDLQAMLGIGKADMGPQDRLSALEYASKLYEEENARYMQQKGINELVGMKNRIAQDPNRAKAQSIANGLTDYNLSDAEYQMVKNRTAGDYAKGLSQIRTGLSGAAAATGMDPSAYAGSYAEGAIGNRQGLANRMGQMDVERAGERRTNQLTNLDVNRQLSSQYTGADSAASMALANMLAGKADIGAAPYAGAGDTAANLYAVNTMNNATDEAANAAEDAATWSKYRDIAGLFMSGMGGGYGGA